MKQQSDSFAFDFSDDGEDDYNNTSPGITDQNTITHTQQSKRKAKAQLFRSNHKQYAAATPQLAQAEAKRNERLIQHYHLAEGISERPYHRAIVREDVFTVAGKQLSSGDIVEVHWLASSHYDLTVYQVHDYHMSLLTETERQQIKDIFLTNVDPSKQQPQQSQINIKIQPKPLNLFQLPTPCNALSPPQLTVSVENTPWYITPRDRRGQGDLVNGGKAQQQTKTLVEQLHDLFEILPGHFTMVHDPQHPLDGVLITQTGNDKNMNTSTTTTIQYSVAFDQLPFTINPVKVQISNLTFITAPQTIELIRSIQSGQTTLTPDIYSDQNFNRNTHFLLELYPFLDLMPYSETHPFPDLSETLSQPGPLQNNKNTHSPKFFQELDFPLHFSSAPLLVESSLQTWTWPISSDYFIKNIFNKKCFVVHAGGQRLNQVKNDLNQFHVKSLIESSPSTIIWMKTKPNQTPNTTIGELSHDQSMYYISTGPETAFAAYLAGHTIYFNPIDPIQAKYVKSLAIELGHSYGYTPTSGQFDDEDGMAHLDETGNFGGDMEIFAVNASHTTDWHFDSQHNISIQLTGTKVWYVLGGIEEPVTNYHAKSINKQSVVADRYMHQFSTMASGENGVGLGNDRKWTNQEEHSLNRSNFDFHPGVQKFHVRPGTIFYHPAGTYHKVVADSNIGGSLSLNISLDCLRYSDIIMSTLSQMIMTNPSLRKRINVHKDDVDGLVRNALENIIPQMLQSVVGNNSDSHSPQQQPGQQAPSPSNITQPNTTNPRRNTGIVIPALYTSAQIHDFPIARILAQPSHLHFTALSMLIYKDHGCINLHQHLHLDQDLVALLFSTRETSDDDGVTTAKFQSPLFQQLLKLNHYTAQYYPQIATGIDSLRIEEEQGEKDSATTNTNQTVANRLLVLIDQYLDKSPLITNPLVALISNEPQYIISPGGADTSERQKTALNISITHMQPPAPSTSQQYTSQWPHTTPSTLSDLDASPQLGDLQSLLSNNTIDLSTLPLLFTDKRFSATHHLYSICTGFSTHGTTSNLTPGAMNTKIAPQYSIGVVLDSKSLSFTTTVSATSSTSTPSASVFNQRQQTLKDKKNHIFLNVLLFLHWSLQHGIKFTFTTLFKSIELVSLFGSNNDTNPGGQLSPMQKLMLRIFILNVIGLYTHCGVFIPNIGTAQ